MCLVCICWQLSVFYLTSTESSAGASPIQLQKHPGTIRISYIFSVIIVPSTIPHCRSKTLLMRKVHIYIYFTAWMSNGECHWMENGECHWTQMKFCHYTRLTMTLFQYFVLLLHHSSGACCLSAVSMESSLLWKTSNLIANSNMSKLSLTVSLGSIHLRPCCLC